MYPYEIVFGLTLYDILIAVGIAVAIFMFSALADKRKLKGRLQNFRVVFRFAHPKRV